MEKTGIICRLFLFVDKICVAASRLLDEQSRFRSKSEQISQQLLYGHLQYWARLSKSRFPQRPNGPLCRLIHLPIISSSHPFRTHNLPIDTILMRYGIVSYSGHHVGGSVSLLFHSMPCQTTFRDGQIPARCWSWTLCKGNGTYYLPWRSTSENLWAKLCV